MFELAEKLPNHIKQLQQINVCMSALPFEVQKDKYAPKSIQQQRLGNKANHNIENVQQIVTGANTL